ncbi:sigma-54 dependent transcriptional regulator [Psychrosphaera sp. B3R10]|uniref:sigma-54-dependent transcriptional regulator n=1 Tax=unclassified Psychrosphaera TaxID=2641570 RepID=UPI001C07F782|nr:MULTISPECIES: sigma-54 dependent transcriptional regulator [unclassified Psychrosphaera]MBU2883506.1 sigma-54 dependent transcriptional regulator [Psychrosphaera sp. I2R16]MBU2989685.1 sigma-54 dependent transcriptional regulator [Psychrosphaera sp. B3R10]
MSQTQILVVEDDSGLREALVDTLSIAGYSVVEADSAEAALVVMKQRVIDLIVSDVQMGGLTGLDLLKSVKKLYPQTPFLLMTAYATIDHAVEAMKYGAIDYMAKPFAPEVLLNMVGRYAPVKQVEKHSPVVADIKSIELLKLAAKVAVSEASVMITGPSGAGKEVMARYIHDQSNRAEHDFVAINCAAIPDNMLEATLFGYEKGAFTGAIQACPGKFEQAQHGTILLDEITEMDLNLQAKLLRVLQEREVERLGSRKTIKLDVRVLATSNRDLMEAVRCGKFREDLYYRLNVFPIRWLRLSKRKDDIIPIAMHLLNRYCVDMGREIPEISPTAKMKLLNHSWPGNVRELDNVIQRALILCTDSNVESEHILVEEFAVDHVAAEIQASEYADDTPDFKMEIRDQENRIILDTLQMCQGKRKDVAEKLGISPRTLRYKLAKMREQGIEVPA